MALAAYFDDSREYWNGFAFHAIAGYVATTEFWDTYFSPRWSKLLSEAPHPLSEYKSSDCRSLTNEFAGWTRREANAFAINAIDQIVDFPTGTLFGVGTVILLPAHEDSGVAKTDEANSLWLALMNVAGAICSYIRTTGRTDPIHFLCDEQPGLQGMLADFWSRIIKGTENDFPFELSHLDFDDSKRFMPLQLADMLAYETRKDLKDRIERPGFRRSMALHRLLVRHPHQAFYIDSNILREWDKLMNHGEEYPFPPYLYNSSPWEYSLRPVYLEDPRPPHP